MNVSENQTELNSHLINVFIECADVGSVCFIAFLLTFQGFLLLILAFFRVYHPPSDPTHGDCPAVARTRLLLVETMVPPPPPRPQKAAIGDGERSSRRRNIVPKETHSEERETEKVISASSTSILRCEPAPAGGHAGESGLSPVKQAFPCMMNA